MFLVRSAIEGHGLEFALCHLSYYCCKIVFISIFKQIVCTYSLGCKSDKWLALGVVIWLCFECDHSQYVNLHLSDLGCGHRMWSSDWSHRLTDLGCGRRTDLGCDCLALDVVIWSWMWLSDWHWMWSSGLGCGCLTSLGCGHLALDVLVWLALDVVIWPWMCLSDWPWMWSSDWPWMWSSDWPWMWSSDWPWKWIGSDRP